MRVAMKSSTVHNTLCTHNQSVRSDEKYEEKVYKILYVSVSRPRAFLCKLKTCHPALAAQTQTTAVSEMQLRRSHRGLQHFTSCRDIISLLGRMMPSKRFCMRNIHKLRVWGMKLDKSDFS